MSEDVASPRRTLHFESYREIADEIGRLRDGAYRPIGQWSLGQTAGHLSYFLRGSLAGFDFKLPWVVRFVLGRIYLKRILKTGIMPAGGPTVPASLIATDRSPAQEDALIEDCLLWLGRLDEYDGPLNPSPLLGDLTPEQWLRLHCIHAAHHLGFLLPIERSDVNLEETIPS